MRHASSIKATASLESSTERFRRRNGQLRGQSAASTPPAGREVQREMAFRAGVNIVVYALTGNYKADQVHVPALLERLGQ